MVKKVIAWATHHKEHVATVALVLGFFVDVITFRNINLDISELILLVNLVIVAGSILILSIPTRETKTFFGQVRSWIPVAQQYSMGNLLSAFLILYSASGSIAASWPFLLLVLAAAIGNETFKRPEYRLPFQTTLFFLNLMLFAVLAVPIALNRIGAFTFAIGIAIAGGVFALFTATGRLIARRAFAEHLMRIRMGAVAVAALLIVFYFTNLIPPIPLSVKTTGVYHAVTHEDDTYVVTREVRSFLARFFDLDGETLHLKNGETAYVFTSVFAPADFSESIVHRWQYFNDATGKWETWNTVRFPIVGGRHGGYRGYSLTENPKPGKWRVSVETVRGQVLGRVYFTVERATTAPETELFTL